MSNCEKHDLVNRGMSIPLSFHAQGRHLAPPLGWWFYRWQPPMTVVNSSDVIPKGRSTHIRHKMSFKCRSMTYSIFSKERCDTSLELTGGSPEWGSSTLKWRTPTGLLEKDLGWVWACFRKPRSFFSLSGKLLLLISDGKLLES